MKTPRRPSEHPRQEPMGELALIEQIRRTFAARPGGSAVTLGIGDDCAILHPPPNAEILVTTDFSLEGRHFRRDLHPPEAIGHRCLARGLSDLAAMGATPLAAFLSLALPASLLATSKGRVWIKRFFKGMQALAAQHNVPLAGGDTSESPRETEETEGLILADIVLLGSAPRGKALRRSGAHPGDLLYVTGHLGGAAAELASMLDRPPRIARASSTANHPHLYPQPRLATGKALLRRGLATAAIDLSDGLSTDLAHLCQTSGVHAEVDQSALPLHPLTRKLSPAAALHAAVNGGEDYELLFTAPPSVKMPASLAGVPITRIGSLTRAHRGAPPMTLLKPDGTRVPLKPAGWEHFTAT
jgi:thiamine-monophosphate kinase